jgi:hypothetical protein
MKTRTIAFWCVALAMGGCGGDDGATTTPDARPQTQADAAAGGADAAAQPTSIDVTENIAADTTWRAGTTYHLKQKASGAEGGPYIFVTAPATLTIEAGTRIAGGEGTALVIARGAKIQAVGTAESPIVFTHDAPAGQREGGKWGGLVILGAAPHNIATAANTPFEAFNQLGGIGNFGGTDAGDSSGTLRYVRIEFGGFAYTTDREFNGLTLAGVGSGTSIDYVQIHRGSDDGIELFGGTVNLRHVVISQNQDDGFDTDNGYSGKVQFLVIQNIAGNTSDGSHGYESDNHAAPDTNFNNLPRTNPTIYNATLIGNRNTSVPHFGAIWRRGTSGRYYNHIVTNFKNAAIEVRDAATATQAGGADPALNISYSILAGNATDWATQAMNDVLSEMDTWAGKNGNLTMDPTMPAGATSATDPSFKPTALVTGATPPDDGFFDTSATFIGAIGATDWTVGWTSYPAN